MLATADYRREVGPSWPVHRRAMRDQRSVAEGDVRSFRGVERLAAAEGCEPLSRRAFSEAVASRRPEAGHEIKGVRSNGKGGSTASG